MRSDIQTTSLYIGGMTCTGCQTRIQQAVSALPGVKSVRVSLSAGRADITYDPAALSLRRIRTTIEKAGYTVSTQKPPRLVIRSIALTGGICGLFWLLETTGLLNQLAPAQLADSGMGLGMLFVIGLLTSLHCVAMCGGLHLSQCLPQGDSPRSRREAFGPPLLYNAGRVLSYTVIGGLLGLVGMLLGGGATGGLSPLLQGLLKILAGLFMIVMGINLLGTFPGLRRFALPLPKKLTAAAGKASSRSRRPFVVGLLNGLMPCGPLQSMQIVALASGDPLTGALSMLLFGLGTAPLMLGFGSLAAALGQRFSRVVTTVGAVLVVVLGLAMLSQGGSLSGLFASSSLLVLVGVLTLIGIVSLLPYKKAAHRTACIALSACVGAASFAVAVIGWPQKNTEAPAVSPAASDGIQLVHSTLEPGRYPDITVRAEQPVRWTIDAPSTSLNGCNNRLIIQEYGLAYTLQPGENIIEFTPDRAVSVPYSCWMGMIRGTITVTA